MNPGGFVIDAYDKVTANPPYGRNFTVSKPSPILAALDAESYGWMETNAPDLLSAIEQEVAAGKRPWQLARTVLIYVGPERDGLAKRVLQAASHVERMQAA